MTNLASLGKQINELLISNPTLAADKAVAFGLTPPQLLEATDVERDHLSQATPGWIHVGPTQARIRTYTFQPLHSNSTTTKSVILSASFGNTSNAMLRFVPPLQTANLRVILFDHNAHGDSSSTGPTFDLRLDISTVAELAKKYAPLAGMIGFSLGATAIMGTLIMNPDIIIPKFVCISPSLSTKTVRVASARRLGCPPEIADIMYKRGVEKGVYWQDELGRDIARCSIISKTEALVIHDQQDPIAIVSEGEWLATRFEHSTFESTTGLKHFGMIKSEHVIRLATEFIIGKKPQPSLKL